MADLSGGMLRSIDERLTRVEQLLPSIQARLKTVERNAPLEVRIRALEQRLDSEVVPRSSQSRHHVLGSMIPLPGFGYVLLALRRWLTVIWQSALVPCHSAIVNSAPLRVKLQPQSRPANASLHTPSSSEPETLLASQASEPKATVRHGSSLEAQARIRLLHREACAKGEDTYKDPSTGYDVFTANFLRTRDCCGSGCRHCPWGHRNVPARHSPATASAGNVPKSTLYTRKGDTGWTNLYNEEWVLKSTPVYDAIGDVDELNSALGLARAILSEGIDSGLSQQLEILQGWLLDVGSALCTPRNTTQHARKLQRTRGVTEEVIADLETWIDQGDAALRLLRHFILPGGSPGGGALHLARTICRRAERHTWPLILQGHAEELLGIFLNRLSDYLFVVARLDALASGSDEQEYRIESKVDRWQRQIHTGETNTTKVPTVPLEPHRWHEIQDV